MYSGIINLRAKTENISLGIIYLAPIPDKPNELAVNVWNADDAWKIVWLEDGIRKGAMRQETGYDPLSVELHSGKDKPERRAWVDPELTDHLFFAPVIITSQTGNH